MCLVGVGVGLMVDPRAGPDGRRKVFGPSRGPRFRQSWGTARKARAISLTSLNGSDRNPRQPRPSRHFPPQRDHLGRVAPMHRARLADTLKSPRQSGLAFGRFVAGLSLGLSMQRRLSCIRRPGRRRPRARGCRQGLRGDQPRGHLRLCLIPSAGAPRQSGWFARQSG